MPGVVGESRNHVETISESPLTNGDEGGADGEQHHEERPPDAVANEAKDVDAYKNRGDDPGRDTEEERCVRVLSSKDGQHHGAKEPEPHFGGGRKVSDDRDEQCGRNGDGDDESGESNSAHHFFNDVSEVPEEEQGDEHPSARWRGCDRPGDKAPDFELAYR